MQVTDVCAVIAIGLSSQFGLRGRLPWDGNRGREYVADVERFFYSTPWLEHEVPGFDICLYNAGMDPFEGCSIGGIEGVTQKVLRDREMTVSHGVGCEAFPSCSSLRGDTSGSLSARGLTAKVRAKRSSTLPRCPLS